MKASETSGKEKKSPVLKIGLSVIVLASVFGYILFVVTGRIPSYNRIDWVTFALLFFAITFAVIMITPGIFDRLKLFEVQGFKLEMLEKVKEKQAEQESRLADIALVLPLLLPNSERKHLLNLDDRKTNYTGDHSVRSELRRLRTAGLIYSQTGTTIAQLEDGKKIDISSLVALTPLGKSWANRIREIDQLQDSGDSP